ncbi:hypothetical protein PoB_005472700 [Plakobranchus ocellatus]|uniref:Uncharacterized protein n=1 Tax=Plakobranchus ocellatus TaxID=259542 RepID=A0AAV4CA28_9GAST|nr:hypothetical protein PoB_005472700 [Plakobranchus ocellatus]
MVTKQVCIYTQSVESQELILRNRSTLKKILISVIAYVNSTGQAMQIKYGKRIALHDSLWDIAMCSIEYLDGSYAGTRRAQKSRLQTLGSCKIPHLMRDCIHASK